MAVRGAAQEVRGVGWWVDAWMDLWGLRSLECLVECVLCVSLSPSDASLSVVLLPLLAIASLVCLLALMFECNGCAPAEASDVPGEAMTRRSLKTLGAWVCVYVGLGLQVRLAVGDLVVPL